MHSLLGRLLIVVAVAVLPALAFQAYTESQARQTRQQLLEEEALRLVRLVGAEQQRIIEGADQMLTLLSVAPAVQDNIGGLCQHLLSGLSEATERYRAVAVISLDGHPLCATPSYDSRADLSDRPYFKRALETGGFVVGNYTIDPLTGQPVIPVARPFKGREGTVAGIVVAELSLAWLGQELQALPLPADASTTVADRAGTILARTPEGARFTGTALPQRNRHVLEEPGPGIVSLKAVDGRFRVLAYMPPAVGPGGLYISVGLDPKATLASIEQANRIGIILIVAGAAFAAALTALLGTHLIRRPVNGLLRAADRWRTGDLSARTGLRPDASEFGRLSTAFDAMAAALQSREKALRTALESTTDAVMAFDRDWRFTYLNKPAEKQLEPLHDVLGKVIRDVFPEPSSGALGDACRKAMEAGVPANADIYYAPLDRYWEIHAYPSEGGITVFSRDVTEQRRVTAALRRSEERLRLALSAARLGVREIDFVRNEANWTPEAERILGPEGVRSATFDAWIGRVHPDDQPEIRARWSRAMENPENAYGAECRYLQPDGTWRWVDAYGQMVFEDGRAIRAVTVVMDISVRKQIETELKQATTLLRAIGDSSTDAIYAKDSQGRFLYANPAVLAIMGKTAEAVIGHTDAELHHDPEQAAAVMANDKRIVQTGIPEIIEEVFDATGIGKRVFRSAKSPLRLDDGAISGIVAVSSDITPLKTAEAELRSLTAGLEARVIQEVAAREAAQTRAAHAERMQALGQLAGGIAHDFNNVLQAVSGAMALMGRRADDAASIRRLARLASEATERGAAITRRLLAFGRRGDLRAEAIDAGQLLSELREILVHTLGAGIDVQVRADADLRPFVADKSQLETSLINLATNARDAMPRGGRLTMAATAEIVRDGSPGHPAGIAPGRYVRITVADGGTGMDAATLARSIEPFFTTKTVGAGSGLGLSMAKGFAEQSGGGMSVASAPGQGTTVTLWLPEAPAELAAEMPAAAAEPAEASGAPPAVRVLLVDDESPVREVLTMQLEDSGFSVLPAASGAEALALLASGAAVEILLTDLSMPGMDGLAVIRAAQGSRPGLPAVLLTGYASDGIALALGGAVSGSFSLLRKPVTAADLVDRLRALLPAQPEPVSPAAATVGGFA